MIQRIEFIDPAKAALPKTAFGVIRPSYAFSLDAIKGRTYEFKPGVNVVIGENGCGKTSLLNIIRHLTFCDELFCSSIREGREYWELHAQQSYEEGYWNLAKVSNPTLKVWAW